MTDQIQQAEDCISKRPWGEVLSRSAKIFTFRMASEGGRSMGRILFYVLLGLLVLALLFWGLNAVTGWFSGFFDFWPFAEAPAAEETKWYCRWNPVC